MKNQMHGNKMPKIS